MSKTWKIILFIIAFVGIAAAGFWVYQNYFQSRKANLPVISAVSPSMVFFLETTQPQKAFNQLNTAELWQYLINLEGIKQVGEQFQSIDSVVSNDQSISKSLASSTLIVSFNLNVENEIKPVFLITGSNSLKSFPADALIGKIYGVESIVMEKPFNGAFIKVVNLSKRNAFFYYTRYKGVFAGSFSEELVQETILQLSSGNAILDQKGFRKVRATAGQNVDANLYINGPKFGNWITSYSNVQVKSLMQELSRFWEWTEADLVLNNNELLLNGYSVPSDYEAQLLSCFEQGPQDITIPEVLPYNIAYLTHYGFEDFQTFYAAFLLQRSDSTQTLQQLKTYNDKFRISPYEEIISWVGSEVALAGIDNPQGITEQVAIIKAADILKARISLQAVSKKVNRKKILKPFELKSGDYKIQKLNLPSILEVLCGSIYKGVHENYYVLIKDYVVFANSPDVLVSMIEQFYKGKTLSEDLNYKTFSNNISVRSNIFLYTNIRKSAKIAHKIFNKDFGSWIEDNAGALGNLEGIALQLSFINQMFYTNIYLKYNPNYKEVNPSTWSFETDGAIAGKPVLIRNHHNNKLNTVVFDTDHNMYLADHVGKIKWKLPLTEAPISDLIHVDYFGNGKTQYLFNTANYMYLVDLNGDYVADFPVRLSQPATGSVTCFDYDKNRDYRFVIPLNDNRIYNFDKTMKPVEGWTKIQTRTAVQKPVQHFVADNKDYFIVTDANGQVLITDRAGEERIKLKQNIEVSKHNQFYLNQTNSKGLFITTNTEGDLLYIGEDGNIEMTDFGTNTDNHYFFYLDFDKDKAEDFMFIDGTNLTVYNRFKKNIFKFTLSQSVQSKPVVFKDNSGQVIIALHLKNSGKVLFLDQNGKRFEATGITGTGGIAVGSINNDAIINALVPGDRQVKNYLLE